MATLGIDPSLLEDPTFDEDDMGMNDADDNFDYDAIMAEINVAPKKKVVASKTTSTQSKSTTIKINFYIFFFYIFIFLSFYLFFIFYFIKFIKFYNYFS